MTRATLLLLAVLLVFTYADEHDHSSPLDSMNHQRKIKIDNSIVFTINTTLLARSGDAVTVTFSGVPSPTIQDFIGAFSPNNMSTVPIRYKYATNSEGYLGTGSGQLTFNLVNQRSEYVLAFVRNSFEQPIVAAKTSEVTFKQGKIEPTAAHLSLTSNPKEMKLQWTSATVSAPTVKWSTQSQTYSQTAAANATTYKQSDLCGPRATDIGWRDPGIFYTAVMNDLLPNTKYYYVFGDSATNTWSDERVMYTPHPKESNTHVLIFGDMGHAPRDGSKEVDEQEPALNTTTLMTAEVSKGNVDLVLHIGDISYARGYSHLWDEFLYDIDGIASRVPYMTAAGNHEIDYPKTSSMWPGHDSGGECGVPYSTRFPMIRGDAKYPENIYYSFNMGYAHYLIIDTEHDFTVGSAQYNFIVKDLQSVDRSITPWLIVAGHRPQYISSTNENLPAGDLPVARLLRKNLDPLFKQYKVDVAFWGHHHSYQRTCPVNEEQCVKDGTVHIVVGAAGQGLSLNVKYPRPDYFEFVECIYYGYGRMSITKNQLAFEFVSDYNGKVTDAWKLNK